MLEISNHPQPLSELDRTSGASTQTSLAEVNTSSALRGLAGLSILVVVAQNLGFPVFGGSIALDVLLLTVGCSTANTVLAYSNNRNWLRPFWLDQIGRAYPGLLALLVLLAAHWHFTQGGLQQAQLEALVASATMTSSYATIFGGAELATTEHLWVIGLVWQFTIVAPILILAGRRTFGPNRRAAALSMLAATVIAVRITLLLTSNFSVSAIAQNPLTRIDSLLIGLAVGIVPLAALHKHPTARLVPIALIGVSALAVYATWFASSPIRLGLVGPVAAVLAGAVVAADRIDTLTPTITKVLDSSLLQWAGTRAFSIYLWHYPLGFALDSGSIGTPSRIAIIIVGATLSSAAATVSYRHIEIPSRVLLRNAASRRLDRINANLAVSGSAPQPTSAIEAV